MRLDTSYWRALDPPSICIHPEDRAYVDAHNLLLRRAVERAQQSEDPKAQRARDNEHAYCIRVDRLAEPRLGRIDAPIVLLQLNPSFDDLPQDYAQQFSDLLDPCSEHAGLRDTQNLWWPIKFKRLIDRHSRAVLQRLVCSIEFFPYASRSFNHAHLRLPSQQFQFELVRSALKRDAILIVTRGLDLWCGAVPELAAALGTKAFRTVNPQNAAVTLGNLHPMAWTMLNELIDNHK